ERPRLRRLDDRGSEAPADKAGMDVAVGGRLLPADVEARIRGDRSVPLPQPCVAVEVDPPPRIEQVLEGEAGVDAESLVDGGAEPVHGPRVLVRRPPELELRRRRDHRASPEAASGRGARVSAPAPGARRAG